MEHPNLGAAQDLSGDAIRVFRYVFVVYLGHEVAHLHISFSQILN